MPGHDDDKTALGRPLRAAVPPVARPELTPEAPEKTVVWHPLGGPTQSELTAGPGPNATYPGPHPLPSPMAGAPEGRPEARALADILPELGQSATHFANPLMAVATPLLTLLGRMRQGAVDPAAPGLAAYVQSEIARAGQVAQASGLAPGLVTDAQYTLAATADDVALNLPGLAADWAQQPMVARFFGERSGGAGVFQRLDAAMRHPAQSAPLLELMLTCLSLGLVGPYRATPDSAQALERMRKSIHNTLRQTETGGGTGLSPRWKAVPLAGAKKARALPLWLIAGVAAAMVVALYATLSTLLTREGVAVRNQIAALHSGLPGLVIERRQPEIEPFVAPPTTQMARLEAALANELASGAVAVERAGAYLRLNLGAAPQFSSGAAELVGNFSDLGLSIGAALEAEAGPIRIVGHTDDIPLSGRGLYPTNIALSAARAQVLADLIAPALSDPSRLEVQGQGAIAPVADNGTREGRARNRRVEILLLRETP